MSRPPSLLLSAMLLACVCHASAQTFLPKNIQFKGDDAYSQQELLTAAALKPGVALTAADMNDHTKLLMDTGLFQNINYAFDGEDLVFTILPAANLYRPRYENFPFPLGAEFTGRLREKLPLYRGLLPLQGTLLDAFKNGLTDELTAKGIDGQISTAPSDDLKPGEIGILSFSVSYPVIHVGEVELDGASPDLAPKARDLVRKFVGSPFSSAGSSSQLELEIGNFYHEQGYLETTVHAVASTDFTNDNEGLHVPFRVVVKEGPQYRLGRVQLAATMIVSQEAFDKQSDLHAGETASLEKLRANWLYLLRQYHNQGFMKASVHATPTFDRSQHTVSYAVAAEPGAVYTMGALKITTGSDDVRNLLLAAWPLPKGATFNEGAIRSMTATKDVNPALERLFLHNDLRYALALHDQERTVDVSLSLERSH